MLVLLIASFAAQWFVLHRPARPTAAESRAVARQRRGAGARLGRG